MSLRQRRAVMTGSGLSSRVSQWKARGFIKSVQTGSVVIANGALTATATLAAVDPANSFVLFAGQAFNNGADVISSRFQGYLTLTNATTVTATRMDANAQLTVNFTVVEYVPGVMKSVQAFTITVGAGLLTATATVTEVDVSKTLLVFGGTNTSEPNGHGAHFCARLTLTNSTTVTLARDGSNNVATGTGTAVQFY